MGSHDDLTREQIMRMHEAGLAVRLPMIEAIRESGGGLLGFLQLAGMGPILAEAKRVDGANSALAIDILDRVGWPTESMVGQEAAEAWTHLIAQRVSAEALDHSLPHLRAAAARGEVSRATIAQVEDRTDVMHGRPQRCGTQWTQSPERGYEPHPLDDALKVEERRARLGLVSLAEHKRQMEEMFGAP